ncbi:LysR family transcriptional regulator [Sphingobium sp. CFD-2]|uniref:LysR family transcriptional regulator n=1 Tax=Sphingobium sp. CFD-2 TaxID=2878542 RepID=UPI00214CE9E0|nr:LysR family transcriptional regulator [Sphingobium sp. CFD-2]
MDRFGEMSVLVQIVENGGFSAAARALSMTPSAVSKLVGRMEERLGTRLFHRTSRSVVLTAEGQLFYAAALRALDALEDAEAVNDSILRGTLRIRSMPTFAKYQILPLLPRFRERHPHLRLEFHLDNEWLNPLEGGIDVALVGGLPADSAFVTRKISTTRWLICAAPAYLAHRGRPTSLCELDRHDCLGFTMNTPWNLWSRPGSGEMENVRVPDTIASNQGEMLIALAKAGLGILRTAEYAIAEDLRDGSLIDLFPESAALPEEPIYIVFRDQAHLSARTRTFVDFVVESFRGTPPWSIRASQILEEVRVENQFDSRHPAPNGRLFVDTGRQLGRAS